MKCEAVSSVVIVVAFGGLGVARAGSTHATPPVNVVAAPSTLYPDDLPGPQLEIVRDPKQVEPPAPPAFELPTAEPGFHGPRELRVLGRTLRGSELKVKGYVTWIYDCAAELARVNGDATSAEIEESIDNAPALCDAPMFSLGDARTTTREHSIWVVDVPRPPSRAERAQKSRAELAAWPVMPKIAVGDHVVVTGRWAIESPRGERNAGGLLVYRAVERQAPPAPRPSVAARSGTPDIAVVTDVPLRPVVDTRIRNTSVDRLNACNRALTAKQFDVAITECRASTEAWNDNHLAWYGWASAHMARGEWRQAATAITRAVALRPDLGMYQLYHGMALYESAQLPGGAAGRLDDARDAMLRATRLAPELWRAHYYLGRIYRDLDDARRAAEQLSQAITLHPGYRPSYHALTELYRRWGYADHAIAIGKLATANVPADAELWFELAMAYDTKRADADALDALGKAIAIRPTDASSLLQRGQLLLRKGDPAGARRDLERAASSADPRAVVAKRLATQMLDQLATRRRVVPTSNAHRSPSNYRHIYRPSEEPYEPWTQEDRKYCF